MTTARALHLAMFDAINERDFPALRALLHREYVYMAGDGVERRGPDAGVAVAEIYLNAFPDMELTVRDHYAASDDVSIIEFTATGTHKEELEGIPATGRQVHMPICNVIEARNGKIWREREYFDNLTMMRQLGVTED